MERLDILRLTEAANSAMDARLELIEESDRSRFVDNSERRAKLLRALEMADVLRTRLLDGAMS